MTSTSKLLKELSAFITKGATPTTYGFRWESSGVRFLRSECVSARGLDLTQSMFISEAANRMMSRSEVSDGDLLMTITGNVGRVVRVEGLSRANINQHIARIRLSNSAADSGYVYHYLSQTTIREHYETITTGQAYPQISLAQVRDTEIPLPPIEIQRHVAEVLTEADGSITALERLIAKKQAIKQGMMQQLLTGKTRLPGFNRAWTDAPLLELGTLVTGTTPPTAESSNFGNFLPFISPSEVHGDLDISRPTRYLSRRGAALAKQLPKGSIVVTCIGQIGRTAFLNEDAATNQQITAVVPGDKVHGLFIFYAITFARSRLADAASQQVLPILNKSSLGKIEVRLPALHEQEEIAHVLFEVDAELDALKRRARSARAIKQGMMQELLTGRTRLIPAEVAA